jgi:hypothetical protein
MLTAKLALSFRVAIAVLAALALRGAAKAADDSQPLAFCDVVTHPSSYAGHTVRLTAILSVGYEGQALHDPDCIAQSTWVDIEHPFKHSRKLKRLLSKDHRALVVVEGVFHAEEPYPIDPRFPDGAIKDRLKEMHKQYGHLGSWSSMIEISKVLSVSRVSKGTPQ